MAAAAGKKKTTNRRRRREKRARSLDSDRHRDKRERGTERVSCSLAREGERLKEVKSRAAVEEIIY